MFSVVMFNLHILFKSKYGRRFREKSMDAKKEPGFEPIWVIVYSGVYFGLFDIREKASMEKVCQQLRRGGLNLQASF